MSTGYEPHKQTASRTSGRMYGAVIVMASAILFSAPAQAAISPLLSSRQIDSSDISPFTKWTDLMPRYELQRTDAETKCMGPGCLNRKWEALLADLADKPLQEQVTQINKFFNAVKYVSDQNNFGIADYWQTPYEMMERGGDCEDYAIAKYISLKRLGVSESDLRILVVRDAKLGGIIHAVLEVQVEGVAQILDNQAKTVKAVASVYHYQPVFAINESKWWAYK